MKASRLLVLPAVALVLLAGACREEPQTELVTHLRAMVDRLEEHRESPQQAAEAVEAYVSEHREALAAAQQRLAERRQALSPDEKTDLANELLLDIGPLMERVHGILADNPALAENERLRGALEGLATP